jgi:hypothetical protein
MMENITAYEITGLIYGIGLGLFLVFACKEFINKLKAWFNKPVATNVNYQVTLYVDNLGDDGEIFVHYYWHSDSLMQANLFIDVLCKGCYSDTPIIELHECTYNSSDTQVKSVFLKSIRLGDEYNDFYIISDRPHVVFDYSEKP